MKRRLVGGSALRDRPRRNASGCQRVSQWSFGFRRSRFTFYCLDRRCSPMPNDARQLVLPKPVSCALPAMHLVVQKGTAKHIFSIQAKGCVLV